MNEYPNVFIIKSSKNFWMNEYTCLKTLVYMEILNFLLKVLVVNKLFFGLYLGQIQWYSGKDSGNWGKYSSILG